MFKITKEWLKEKGACSEGTEWFNAQSEERIDNIVKSLIKASRFSWANWVLVRVLSHKQNVMYSCFSAKVSLKYFEKQYPKDKRPRLAIESALRWIKYPTDKNKSAARSAESAARSAAESAARSAESAAESAARSAESAARSAAESAAWKKILLWGLKLLIFKSTLRIK